MTSRHCTVARTPGGPINVASTVYDEDYPTRRLLDLIGDKWTPIVVYIVGEGKQRYSELHRRLPGVSKKMLTQTLRNLERDGLVRSQGLRRGSPESRVRPDALGTGVPRTCHWALPVGAGARGRSEGRPGEPKAAGQARAQVGPDDPMDLDTSNVRPGTRVGSTGRGSTSAPPCDHEKRSGWWYQQGSPPAREA